MRYKPDRVDSGDDSAVGLDGGKGGLGGRELSPNEGKETAGKIQSFDGQNNSVVSGNKIQSFTPVNEVKTTEKQKQKTTELSEDDEDEWRFEIKRKKRTADRKNSGSTAREDWYYWVIRIRKSDNLIVYYGTLDILDEENPERLHKYFKRSKGRKKNAKNRR